MGIKEEVDIFRRKKEAERLNHQKEKIGSKGEEEERLMKDFIDGLRWNDIKASGFASEHSARIETHSWKVKVHISIGRGGAEVVSYLIPRYLKSPNQLSKEDLDIIEMMTVSELETSFASEYTEIKKLLKFQHKVVPDRTSPVKVLIEELNLRWKDQEEEQYSTLMDDY